MLSRGGSRQSAPRSVFGSFRRQGAALARRVRKIRQAVPQNTRDRRKEGRQNEQDSFLGAFDLCCDTAARHRRVDRLARCDNARAQPEKGIPADRTRRCRRRAYHDARLIRNSRAVQYFRLKIKQIKQK